MVIQVSKDFLNDRRVFNAGNDLEETGAFVANTGLLEMSAADCRMLRWRALVPQKNAVAI